MYIAEHTGRVKLRQHEIADYVAMCKVVEGNSRLPNLLGVGDVLDLPTKAEWKGRKK
jgi:hypothetical protein